MVKLRLKRMGSKKRPFYRLIAADSRAPRDGRFIETLGFYNPVAKPAVVHFDETLVFKWFERGAVPTTVAASLLRQVGYLQKWKLMQRGVTGEALDNQVEAIRNQAAAAAARREKKKAGSLSQKARAKVADKAADDSKAEAAPKEEAAAKEEAPKAEAAPKEEAPEADATPDGAEDSDSKES